MDLNSIYILTHLKNWGQTGRSPASGCIPQQRTATAGGWPSLPTLPQLRVPQLCFFCKAGHNAAGSKSVFLSSARRGPRCPAFRRKESWGGPFRGGAGKKQSWASPLENWGTSRLSPAFSQEEFNREFTAGLILFGLFTLIVLSVGWKIGKYA